MNLKLLYSGVRSKVYVLVLSDGSSPARMFLETLERNNPISHRTMMFRYTRHADHGPSKNIEHSRIIKGYKNLFEFKTKAGDRLIYFYHSRGTILANGFHKGDPTKPEYGRAERYQAELLEQEKK